MPRYRAVPGDSDRGFIQFQHMHKTTALPQAFAQLGLEAPLLQALAKMNFVEPTEIQRQIIPLILQGKDVMGQARTGTGKTAAFGLPLLQMLRPETGLEMLALVPTRELAVQIAAELRRMAEILPLRIVPVYGGQRIKTQLHLLGRKPSVVVGTPGRVMDLYDRRALDFSRIRFVVLDEVDRMLDIGFRDDIRKILGDIQNPHQTVFVSATFTDEITRLARRHMNEPLEVNVSRDELTVESVAQLYVSVDPWDKFPLLCKIIEQEKPRLAIVFCNTKRAVERLTNHLHAAGIDAREIHGDLVQSKRERVMERFRKHNLHVLVATDLASRGIDVNGISHIINYDVPDDPHVYVHRIGRTARMGTFGKAIMFVTPEQGKQLTEVEKLINHEVVPLEVPGFERRPSRESYSAPHKSQEAAPAQPAPPASAPSQPVDDFGAGLSDASQPPSAPVQSLGAKGKPRRRRLR